MNGYRTDLLSQQERGAGAAAATLGYRESMLWIGAGGFLIAGQFGWQTSFAIAGGLMLVMAPLTVLAPRLQRLKGPAPSLKETLIGPAKEFLARTGKTQGV